MCLSVSGIYFAGNEMGSWWLRLPSSFQSEICRRGLARRARTPPPPTRQHLRLSRDNLRRRKFACVSDRSRVCSAASLIPERTAANLARILPDAIIAAMDHRTMPHDRSIAQAESRATCISRISESLSDADNDVITAHSCVRTRAIRVTVPRSTRGRNLCRTHACGCAFPVTFLETLTFLQISQNHCGRESVRVDLCVEVFRAG